MRRRDVTLFVLTTIVFAALLPALGPREAIASVTLGQLSGDPEAIGCGPGFDRVQPTVSSGNSYVVPGVGTIVSWSHNARSTAGQMVVMKVFRKVADPMTYEAVGHDGPHAITPATLNTFATSIAVQPGDFLGLNSSTASSYACASDGTSDTRFLRMGNLDDGQSGDFSTLPPAGRLNVSAVFVPSNAFSFGATTRDKKKGTATVNLSLPNPGNLTASGNGVQAASAGHAVVSNSVGAGPAELLVSAVGKKRKKLKQKGKVTLSVAVTYTPTNGDPATQSVTVPLKKKHKKR